MVGSSNEQKLSDRLTVKKCGLTLSQETFGPHRMSLYMLLIALYSGVRVRTHSHTHTHTHTHTKVTEMMITQ